jgi:hypothetical protein
VYGRLQEVDWDAPWEAGAAVRGENTETQTGGALGLIYGLGLYAWNSAYVDHAGWFHGDVTVQGNLNEIHSSTVIDHPEDPENMILRQNSVISPEDLVVFRGEVQLDRSGEAVVSLPSYFCALVDERLATATVTPIGKPFLTGYDRIDSNGLFRVYGDPNREVSWVVYAQRDDPSAMHLRKPNEQEKDDGIFFKRGEYLYPEAYGKPRRTHTVGGDLSTRDNQQSAPRAKPGD